MSQSPSGSDLGTQAVFPIADASQVGEPRRFAQKLAQRLGFNDTACGKAALIVTESGTNLLKHAGGGELLVHALELGSASRLDMLALDRGPGMTDVERCLQDGYSTAGSPGEGLGALARLSSLFELYTASNVGTALMSSLRSQPDAVADFEVGAVCLPMPGETVCGDGWAIEHQDARKSILVVDGLGHGFGAAEATREALRVFRAHLRQGPVEVMRRLHDALRSTRGAAAAVAEIDRETRQVRYAGVGNIAGAIFTGAASQSMVSHNGTVGYQLHKIQEFIYPFPAGALLIMNSDGLTSQWRLDPYPGLAGRHPALIAGVLYRDFKRGRDDVTVLVARETS